MKTNIDIITQVEGRLLKKKVQEQECTIANLRNHVKALQDVIDRQQSCIDHLLLLELGGDLHG